MSVCVKSTGAMRQPEPGDEELIRKTTRASVTRTGLSQLPEHTEKATIWELLEGRGKTPTGMKLTVHVARCIGFGLVLQPPGQQVLRCSTD